MVVSGKPGIYCQKSHPPGDKTSLLIIKVDATTVSY